MDWKITGAGLPGRDGLWDVGIMGDRISTIAPHIETEAARELEASGRLLIPALVDAHFHLDKALIYDRAPAYEGTFAEAMRETLRLKQSFTIEDMQERGRRVLERAIAHGITAIRSHVEVDPTLGLRSLEAMLPLRQQYAWGITLQLAVFAQEGITNVEGEADLLRQAMHMGGDVIGSAPYVDPDPHRNVQIIFDIAQEFDCDVDFHLDFLDDDAPMLVPFVIEETQRRGWQGRVCLGHMTKLAALTPNELTDIGLALRDTNISILALPASDIYIMARKDTHNVRRGVAPIHRLAELGVNVGVAVNNTQNLFTPFGDGDVLKVALLLAEVLQLGTIEQHRLCLEMATTQAARAIGLVHNLQEGCPADLVLLGASSVSEAIALTPADRTVFKSGHLIAQTTLQRSFSPSAALAL
nr:MULTISPECIES: amidohydrolase family protein [unclassified Leptolyngbya]